MTLCTIGHSTRPIAEFLELLREHRIELLADVRAYPVSKRHPQFTRENLEESLAAAGIEYRWMGEALGGLRRTPRASSPHVALRNDSFRNYADHMETAVFRQGIAQLLDLTLTKRTAVLCAEAVWWRCHRMLIADFLVSVRGVEVLHILAKGNTEPHRTIAPARVDGQKLVYDVKQTAQLF